MQAHYKEHYIQSKGTLWNATHTYGPATIFFMVDLGGFAPPSRTLFSLLHTAITYSIYLFWLCVNLYSTQNSVTGTLDEWAWVDLWLLDQRHLVLDLDELDQNKFPYHVGQF